MFLTRSIFYPALRMSSHLQQKLFTKRNVLKKLPLGLMNFRQQRTCADFKFKTEEQQDENQPATKFALGKLQQKLKLAFTCKKCRARTEKIISKTAYEKGVVIVRCDGCKNNHLIADNLGWFEEFKGKWNIEAVLRDKGESVAKIRNNVGGYFEAIDKEDLAKIVEAQKEEELRHRVSKEDLTETENLNIETKKSS